jgi:hypothetical protein
VVTGTTEGAIIVTTAAITGGIILTGTAIAITAAGAAITAAGAAITAAGAAITAAGVVRPCHNFDAGSRNTAAVPLLG